MWLPSVTLISTYFVRRRVFTVMTAVTGTSTGGVIFPAMIKYLKSAINQSNYITVVMSMLITRIDN